MIGSAGWYAVAASLASEVIGASVHHGLLQQPLSSDSLQDSRPNIVFIFTDDQDVHMNSLSYMPHLQRHMIDQGTLYSRHYCTVALCCPSRVNLWTGKAPHNTNVTDVNPPYGGYPKFVHEGYNEAWLPLWLREAGYDTYYTGKLFNAHTVDNYKDPYPSGWTGSDFLLDPYTYLYLNATYQRNRDPPVSYHGYYSTDVLAEKGYGFLEDAIDSEKPFFLTIAPVAPHSNVEFEESFFNGQPTTPSIRATPPIPAVRHKDLFKDVVVPRTPNFNPDEPSGVSWIKTLPKLNQTVIDSNDDFYRNRLRALQAVDEIVDGVFKRLKEAGILDNTYVFYSSDNGFHVSQHRLQPGKECGFEEDINVPLIVRGPGVAKGKVSEIVTSHSDLAPTFLTLAGARLREDFDGLPIPVRQDTIGAPGFKALHNEHTGIEFWGSALSEGIYDPYVYWNNTYKGLRIHGQGYNYYYSVWCNGEHELYDLNTDPYETNNLYTKDHSSTLITLGEFQPLPAPREHRSRPHMTTKQVTLSNLLPRLDALLLILKSCKARTCTHPWESLHVLGNVHNLLDALEPRYDNYYEEELKDWRVSFDRCEPGYIIDAEGPQASGVSAFDGRWAPRGGAMWHELV